MLKTKILEFDRMINAWHRSNEASRRLDDIPRVGPALATALIASIASCTTGSANVYCRQRLAEQRARMEEIHEEPEQHWALAHDGRFAADRITICLSAGTWPKLCLHQQHPWHRPLLSLLTAYWVFTATLFAAAAIKKIARTRGVSFLRFQFQVRGVV